MMVSPLWRWGLLLLAAAGVSACQPAPYRADYARAAYAPAAPVCAPYTQATQRYRPLRWGGQPYYGQGYRPAGSVYRSARAPAACAPYQARAAYVAPYQPRTYRYVDERLSQSCAPASRQAYVSRSTRYRPARDYYRQDRSSACCY
jgi:hypothetical protein